MQSFHNFLAFSTAFIASLFQCLINLFPFDNQFFRNRPQPILIFQFISPWLGCEGVYVKQLFEHVYLIEVLKSTQVNSTKGTEEKGALPINIGNRSLGDYNLSVFVVFVAQAKIQKVNTTNQRGVSPLRAYLTTSIFESDLVHNNTLDAALSRLE